MIIWLKTKCKYNITWQLEKDKLSEFVIEKNFCLLNYTGKAWWGWLWNYENYEKQLLYVKNIVKINFFRTLPEEL